MWMQANTTPAQQMLPRRAQGTPTHAVARVLIRHTLRAIFVRFFWD